MNFREIVDYLKKIKSHFSAWNVIGFVLTLVLVIALYFKYAPVTSDFEPIDNDQDGFILMNEAGMEIDCDDNNPDIHPNAIDFPEDGVDQDCRGGDEKLDTGGVSGKSLILFNNFTFSGDVTSDRIIENSRVIKVAGTLETAYLKVRASTSEFNGDRNRLHTVYFYLDDGEQGGHLNLKHENGELRSGTFSEADGRPPQLEEIYDLSALHLGQLHSTESQILDVVDHLNDQENHYIGAFVSTGIYGILNEMTLEYECKIGSDCSIELVK